jgi:hypothetical protein
MKTLWTMALGATLLLAGCGGSGSNPTATTLNGAPMAMGDGTARTFVKVDGSGQPVEYGVRISAAALQGLDEHEEKNIVLPLPEVNGLFKTVHLGWNPHGHPPLDIYTLPHFDVHFYTIDDATREAIPGGPDATATKTPAAGFLASDYALDPVSVPAMGTHATDQLSGEFNGGTFDKTYIYGYYDGKIAFLEPMLTRDYLLTSPNVDQTLRLPAKVATAGRYPQTMSIRTEASGDRVIVLSNMKTMAASAE